MKLACQLQSSGRDSDNQGMTKDPQPADKSTAARSSARNPFLPGSIVVVTLGNPRDKFWGMILALAPEGLSMSGIELAGFEDFVLMVKDGEPLSPAVVFFTMERIERIELDLPDGTLPSLSQRFSSKTSLNPEVVLGSHSVSGSSFRAPEDPA